MKKFILILLLFIAYRPTYATTKYVIVDTDLASDCDDASDLAAVFTLQRLGEWKVLGVVISSLNTDSPMAADSIARWNGVTFPDSIGVNQASTPSGSPANTSAYTTDLASRFVPSQSYGDYPEAVSTYRKLLASAPDGSVTILMIGFATPMSGLLQSSADGYSPLDGNDLVAAKVSGIYIASGYLPNSAGYDGGSPEFNLANDATAYSYVAAHSPVPLTWGGIELATFNAGPQASANPLINPVIYAYNLCGVSNRPAYSEAAILVAAYGLNSMYAYGGSNGTMTIDPITGSDAWTATVGESSYLTKVASDGTLGTLWTNLIADSGAGIVLVNGNVCVNANGSNGQTTACTISGQTAGNANIVSVFWCADASCGTNSPAADTVAVTDTKGNSYTCISGSRVNITAAIKQAIQTCSSPNIGTQASNVITATVTSTNTTYYANISASEWMGIAKSNPVDQAAGVGSQSASSPATVTSSATTKPNELVYSFFALGGSGYTIGGSGYAGLNNLPGGITGGDIYKTVATTGAQTATITYSGSQQWLINIETFKPQVPSSSGQVGIFLPGP